MFDRMVSVRAWCRLGICCLLLTLTLASIPLSGATEALPYYTAEHVVVGAKRYWYSANAQHLSGLTGALVERIAAWCGRSAASSSDLDELQKHWRDAAMAWDRLAAVPIGPLVQRRSSRRIDFSPIRSEMIGRALADWEAGVLDLDRVGTPAKGFGALEWILWQRTENARPGTCNYAHMVANEIHTEAQALAQEFSNSRVSTQHLDGADQFDLAELVNQWVGGIERLRWIGIDRPLRVAGAKSQTARLPPWPRALSLSTAASWRSHWQGLRTLGLASSKVIVEPGEGVVPIETLLRSRGLNQLADRLARHALEVDRRMELASDHIERRTAGHAQSPAIPGALAPRGVDRTASSASIKTSTETARRLALSLQQLKHLAESEVAPALNVRIGFTDSDGD